LIAPNKEVLYREVKKQYDSFSKKADVRGVYAACFSNEFSTFSHKLVYVDWQVGTEDPLPGLGEHLTAMTQVQRLYNNISKIIKIYLCKSFLFRWNLLLILFMRT
jgi:protein ERP2